MGESPKCLFGLPAGDLAEVLHHAQGDLRELRQARIFITGGTGFFGKWLLAALARAQTELALDLHVTVLSREPRKFLVHHPEAAIPGFHFEQGDVADFAASDHRHDFIIHAAADTTVFTDEAQEAQRSRTIVEGTRSMLALAKQSGAGRLLYVSSGAVYGAAAGRLSGASEEDAPAPVTPYGRAKKEAEELCGASGVDCVIGRAFAFLGPLLPLEAHFAAGNFLRDAHRGGPILVRGDGTALRSYLYPGDLVVWLLGLLVRGERARAYNIGSDEQVTTAELARRIAAACSPATEVTVQSLQPQGPQNVYLPTVSRAREELGLAVNVPLDEAIRRTLDFLAQ